jgi:hypothetical protein
LNIFDYIKSINEKSYVYDEQNEKEYTSHVINIGLSFFSDTIFLVNEANKYNLNGKMHYDFLYYSVEPRKRWSKWFKKEANQEELDNIIEYFDVSMTKAKELRKVLTTDQLSEIKSKLSKGG